MSTIPYSYLPPNKPTYLFLNASLSFRTHSIAGVGHATSNGHPADTSKARNAILFRHQRLHDSSSRPVSICGLHGTGVQ